MAKLNPEQRREIARKLTVPGQTLRSVAAEYGISHTAALKVARAERRRGKLTEQETEALDRLFAVMHAGGPGHFNERWSPLDVQTVMFALRRLCGAP